MTSYVCSLAYALLRRALTRWNCAHYPPFTCQLSLRRRYELRLAPVVAGQAIEPIVLRRRVLPSTKSRAWENTEISTKFRRSNYTEALVILMTPCAAPARLLLNLDELFIQNI